jgi:hypothetical protein
MKIPAHTEGTSFDSVMPVGGIEFDRCLVLFGRDGKRAVEGLLRHCQKRSKASITDPPAAP